MKFYSTTSTLKNTPTPKESALQPTFSLIVDPLESKGEWLVENFYTLQVNIQIQSQNATQQTSLLARTAYLSDKNRSQLSLEDKIIGQIVSFFYFD